VKTILLIFLDILKQEEQSIVKEPPSLPGEIKGIIGKVEKNYK
jgi:hypothetical protein